MKHQTNSPLINSLIVHYHRKDPFYSVLSQQKKAIFAFMFNHQGLFLKLRFISSHLIGKVLNPM